MVHVPRREIVRGRRRRSRTGGSRPPGARRQPARPWAFQVRSTAKGRDTYAAFTQDGLSPLPTSSKFLATHLPETGYNIRTVQEFLGHRDAEMTMIYTHVLHLGLSEVCRSEIRSPHLTQINLIIDSRKIQCRIQ